MHALEKEEQDVFDALVSEHLSRWRKVIRNENFQRAWCAPGEPFYLNNSAPARELDKLSVDWRSVITPTPRQVQD